MTDSSLSPIVIVIVIVYTEPSLLVWSLPWKNMRQSSSRDSRNSWKKLKFGLRERMKVKTELPALARSSVSVSTAEKK